MIKDITGTQYRRVGKRNNRGAQKMEIDGIVFDSSFEGNRYIALKTCLAAGLIRDLELQVKYPILINDIVVCSYIADFRYYKADGTLVVEDAKGFRDATYRLKAKMFCAQEGMPIWESENKGAMSRNPLLNGALLVSIKDAFPIEMLPKSIQKKVKE